MGKKRIKWIDSLKGLAIIFVVFGHVLLGFLEKNTFPDAVKTLSTIENWIYCWHMPLFFVLSGITYKISCLKNDTADFKKILRNVLNLGIIYLIFQTVLPLLKSIFSQFVNNKVEFSELWKEILLPSTLMWYLWVLIAYYLLFGLLNKLRINKICIVTGCAVLCIAGNYLFADGHFNNICIRNLIICSVYFYVGICYNDIECFISSKKYAVAATVLTVASSILVVWVNLNNDSILDNAVLNTLFKLILAASLIWLCIYIFKSVKSIGENSVLLFLGKNSLVIYLLHTYMVTAVRVVCVKLNLSVLPSIAAAFIIPLLVSSVIASVVQKIPVVKYLFRPIELIDRIKNRS